MASRRVYLFQPRYLLHLLILLSDTHHSAECSRFTSREKAPNKTVTLPSYPTTSWPEMTTPMVYEEIGERMILDGREEDVNTMLQPIPHFEGYANSTNITILNGNTVILHCKVMDLKEKTVSWIRRKGDELHLLTFGTNTYSSDSRYSLIHRPPNDWMLQIKFANERDRGHYECQVSSHPPVIYYVLLDVIVPKVEIVDQRWVLLDDQYYKDGSTIELNCVISHVPHPTTYVTWKHGSRILNYDLSRGGISVKTDILPDGAMSRLFIANANHNDSGNYTCALGHVASTSVYIHILKGLRSQSCSYT